MNIREQIGQRIRKARKELGLSMRALAEKTKNLQPSRINNWERGVRLPGPLEAKELAQALGISAPYLLCLTDDPTPFEIGLSNQVPHLIPTFDFENAVLVEMFIDPHQKNTFTDLKKFEHVSLSQSLQSKVSPQTFAIRLDDDSMTPDFQIGDLLIIDPATSPHPGKFVLAKIENKLKLLFRKYREKQEGFGVKVELVPSNQDWPSVAFSENKKNRIIGTLMELRRSV